MILQTQIKIDKAIVYNYKLSQECSCDGGIIEYIILYDKHYEFTDLDVKQKFHILQSDVHIKRFYQFFGTWPKL